MIIIFQLQATLHYRALVDIIHHRKLPLQILISPILINLLRLRSIPPWRHIPIRIKPPHDRPTHIIHDPERRFPRISPKMIQLIHRHPRHYNKHFRGATITPIARVTYHPCLKINTNGGVIFDAILFHLVSEFLIGRDAKLSEELGHDAVQRDTVIVSFSYQIEKSGRAARTPGGFHFNGDRVYSLIPGDQRVALYRYVLQVAQ
mmetsp:Transcript_14246/g.17953  ORF Transcript_14246/g.17953 Transcript_14246/m.17953 type:complete len:204 (+) Transcript_14246:119-730(+)